MIALAVVAQMIAAGVAAPDSTYATRAVQAMVRAAVVENRRAPAALAGYRATVESELAMLLQDTIGRERLVGAETFAALAHWTPSAYGLHIVGHRSRLAVVPPSLRPGSPSWALPHLYGDRFPFGFIELSTRGTVDTLAPEHPFGSAGARRYIFSGGDTVATIRLRDRAVPIARLHVTPRVTAGEDAAVFEGDIYLDAARHQIVRLHGRFVRLRAPGSAQQRVERVTGTTVATFVDITNGEIDGQFWLPISERVEIHVGSPVLSEARAVWRLSASFGNYQVALTSSDSAAVQGASTTTDITYASADSLDAYASWPVPAAVRVRRTIDDFADVMPPEWRAWGPPRLMFSPSRFAHVLHVNPVEGYYTGLEGKLELRRVAPGWSARGHAGWAWSERTMRGGATLYRARGEWTSTALAERWLEATNDFPVGLPFATASVGGLVGSLQRRDYVDRTTAAVAARRASRDASSSLFGVQVGVGRDRDNVARTRGPFRADSVVPLNRFAQNGSYARAALDYERGQALSLATSAAGARVQLHYEAAAGDLNWQRATAAIRVHRSIGRLLVTQRGDIGIVFASGGIPPQQLFELGGSERLPGYRYKQFVGDRSALFGAGLEYPLPGFRRADRWTLRHRLPAFAPALATSIGGGWTELSSQRARDAALALGRGSAVLVSEATGRMRGTFGLGFTVLSGLVHAGAAVGLDRGARFRPAFGIGASF